MPGDAPVAAAGQTILIRNLKVTWWPTIGPPARSASHHERCGSQKLSDWVRPTRVKSLHAPPTQARARRLTAFCPGLGACVGDLEQALGVGNRLAFEGGAFVNLNRCARLSRASHFEGVVPQGHISPAAGHVINGANTATWVSAERLKTLPPAVSVAVLV